MGPSLRGFLMLLWILPPRILPNSHCEDLRKKNPLLLLTGGRENILFSLTRPALKGNYLPESHQLGLYQSQGGKENSSSDSGKERDLIKGLHNVYYPSHIATTSVKLLYNNSWLQKKLKERKKKERKGEKGKRRRRKRKSKLLKANL